MAAASPPQDRSEPGPARGSSLGRLKVGAIAFSLALVALPVAIQYAVLDRVLPRSGSALVTAALLVVGVAGFSAGIWRLLERAERRLSRAYADERAQRHQLEALAAADIDLGTELDMDVVAQKIVERSRDVTGARYGALAVLGPRGRVDAFYASGLDAETRARLGAPPTGHGLLGLVSAHRAPLVVDDIASHPAAVGFPAHHPRMRTLLAVPVWMLGDVIGNLYVADKEGGAPFTAEDTRALERFAAQAAVAIQYARLHRRLQRLSIVAERERIAMDLHDGVIQSLFGMRLQLEAAAGGLAPGDDVQRQLEGVVDRLGVIMADIRHYIFDLRAEQSEEDDLRVLLDHLLASLQAAPAFRTELRVSGTPRRVARSAQWELWHIAREAMGNAVAHSGGHHLIVALEYGDGLTLEVVDDGRGWDGRSAGKGHNGLDNMRRRSAALGGTLSVDGAPGGGTRVRAWIPDAGAFAPDDEPEPHRAAEA